MRQDKSRDILPHSIEVEQSVLGAMLASRQAAQYGIEKVDLDDFYRHAHQLLFTAMRTLAEKKSEIDFVTLHQQCKDDNTVDEVGGPSYISQLGYGIPNSTNIGHYAAVLRDLRLKRDAYTIGEKIQHAVITGEYGGAELLHAADGWMLDLQQAQMGGALVSQAVAVHDTIADLSKRVERKGQLTGIDTGLITLNEKTAGWQKGNLVVVAARPGVGKAQPSDAKILLADGTWRLMGDIVVGDNVASIDGVASVVTGVYPQGVERIFRMRFSDGRSAECTSHHLWTVCTTRRRAKSHVWTTAEIVSRLRTKRYRGRITLPLTAGRHGKYFNMRLHPWLLGFLLGDGNLRKASVRFSTADLELVDKVRRLVAPSGMVTYSKKYDYTIRQVHGHRWKPGNNQVINELRKFGLMGKRSHEKFIPEICFQGSYDVRLELLRGLLDSDGWVQGNNTVCFTSTSERLTLGVQRLARSLGAIVRPVQVKTPSFTYKGVKKNGQLAYTITISYSVPSMLFGLQRKIARASKVRTRPTLAISSVEYTRDAEAFCISVSHPSGLYITDDYVVTHNTGLTAGLVIAAARAGASVAWFSLEMSRQEVEYRMLSQMSHVPIYRILNGILTDYEFRRVSTALEELATLKIAVDDSESLNAVELRGRCRRHRHECGLDIAFIDYMQLMSSTVKHETRATALADISRRNKMLARELAIPIIQMAQLNRTSEGRDDRRPRLSDIRESGAIEQDADIVILIHRVDHKVSGDAELIVDKGRNVPSGSFIVHFDKDTVTFRDATVSQKEPATPPFPETPEPDGVSHLTPAGARRHVRPRRV